MLVKFNSSLRLIKVNSQKTNLFNHSRNYAVINDKLNPTSAVVKVNIDWNEKVPLMSQFWALGVLHDMAPFEKCYLYLSSRDLTKKEWNIERFVLGLSKYEVMSYTDDSKSKLMLISTIVKDFKSSCKYDCDYDDDSMVIVGSLVKPDDIVINEPQSYEISKLLTTNSVKTGLPEVTLKHSHLNFIWTLIETFDISSMEPISWCGIWDYIVKPTPHLLVVHIATGEGDILMYSKVYAPADNCGAETIDELNFDIERLHYKYGTNCVKILAMFEVKDFK